MQIMVHAYSRFSLKTTYCQSKIADRASRDSQSAILRFGTLKRGDAKTRDKIGGLEPNHRLARANS